MDKPLPLFEDNHLLVVQKPFGMLSQGDPTGDLSLLDWGKSYLKERYQKPGRVYLGLVHRLDRPTGGLLVFARTSKSAARLSQQFRDRQVGKVYLAVVEGCLSGAGTLTDHLGRVPGKNLVRAFSGPRPGTKEAQLEYRALQTVGERSLVEVRPLTGRRHQIRVQLRQLGHPIVGDVKYGNTAPLPDRSIALLAYRLELTHPVRKEPIAVTARWPTNEPWPRFSPP